MILAFTGTRHGLTRPQALALRCLLATSGITEFRHGDCVGADAQAAAIAASLAPRPRIVAHPPIVANLRAFDRHADVTLSPKEYHARNRDLVEAGEALAACPAEGAPKADSGTWWTVRCACLAGKPVVVVWPDGTHDSGWHATAVSGDAPPTGFPRGTPPSAPSPATAAAAVAAFGPPEPVALLAGLRAAGLSLRAEGGRLLVSPAELLTPDRRQVITAHKDAFLAILALPAATPARRTWPRVPPPREPVPGEWEALTAWLAAVQPDRPAPPPQPPAPPAAAAPAPAAPPECRAVTPAPQGEWAVLVAWLRSLGAVPPGPWILGAHADHRGAWRTVEDPARYLTSLRARVEHHLAGPPAFEHPRVDPAAWAAHGRVLAGELRVLKVYLEGRSSHA